MSQLIHILPQTPPEVTRRGRGKTALNGSSALALEAGQHNTARPCAKKQSAAAPRHRPTFALYTLGCKVNQSDSHQIARLLLQRGFRRVEFREVADLYVIDTCTVTSEADRKSRKAAARARRNNPDAVVAVTGCAATYNEDQFRRVVPDALVLSNARKFELPELALQALRQRSQWDSDYRQYREQYGSEPVPNGTPERAVLKVQDGCNHRCAFCIIPTVRGASATKSRATVISEARALIQEGARELIVTGVSMGDWGHTSNTISVDSAAMNGRSRRGTGELCALLRSIATIEGLERLRVSSLDPADVDEDFLQTVARHPVICPHIHLALQAGGAATLRRMRRRYTPEQFLHAARRWREIRPDGGLTTDIIVGFPGETAEDFEASLRVAREARFSTIHVFPYSPRHNTVAATLPDHISPTEQKRRVGALLTLARELERDYASQFVGEVVPVLVETIDDDRVIKGLTPHYLKASIPLTTQSQHVMANAIPAVGDIAWMQVQQWQDDALLGNLHTGSLAQKLIPMSPANSNFVLGVNL